MAEEFTPEEVETGRLLFAKECQFLRGAVSLDDLPDFGLPEIGIVGRSNVGKSSLINALTGRKALARTSNTPGRTQELNFFSLDNRLIIVDMPGYGYAKVPKIQVKNWTKLIKNYLKGRPGLRRVFILIDARHGIKENDREYFKMLDEAAVNYQIVLTKADKVGKTELDKALARTLAELKAHAAAFPQVIVTSSVDGDGLADLRATISTLVDNG